MRDLQLPESWNPVRKFAKLPITEPIKSKTSSPVKMLNVTWEETSNSINYMFVKSKIS